MATTSKSKGNDACQPLHPGAATSASGRTNVGRDVDAEIRFHFQERIDELVAQGHSRDDAERRAHEEFGDLARVGAELRTIGDRMVVRRRRIDGVRTSPRTSGIRSDRSRVRPASRSSGGDAVARHWRERRALLLRRPALLPSSRRRRTAGRLEQALSPCRSPSPGRRAHDAAVPELPGRPRHPGPDRKGKNVRQRVSGGAPRRSVRSTEAIGVRGVRIDASVGRHERSVVDRVETVDGLDPFVGGASISHRSRRRLPQNPRSNCVGAAARPLFGSNGPTTLSCDDTVSRPRKGVCLSRDDTARNARPGVLQFSLMCASTM
jgi:hypothetical protein